MLNQILMAHNAGSTLSRLCLQKQGESQGLPVGGFVRKHRKLCKAQHKCCDRGIRGRISFRSFDLPPSLAKNGFITYILALDIFCVESYYLGQRAENLGPTANLKNDEAKLDFEK